MHDRFASIDARASRVLTGGSSPQSSPVDALTDRGPKMFRGTFSGSRYVGAPPRRRSVTSRAAITDGAVLSRIARTTRNRDQASQATNSVVLHAVDDRAVAEVVLKPHPRLGHPRPVHPHPPQAVVPLDRGDRPAGGPLRAGVPERGQLLMGPVRAQLALRALDPLLQLGQELIDQLRPPPGPVRQGPSRGPRRSGRPYGARHRRGRRHPATTR